MKSVLMIGQSNMAGRGFISEVPVICNERILMLRNGRWQMMTEPINYDRPVAGVGLAGSFAARWCMENKEDKIGLIPCAEGGSSIDDWAVDKTLFKHAVSQAKFALQDSELIGILWHQGESDSSGENYQTYYDRLHIIVKALRKELKVPEIPFIMGGLGDFLGKTGFGLSCTEYGLINQELQRFALEQKNSYFVTAENLTSNPDGIHINAISQRKFGIRYYEAFSKRNNVLNPMENEIELLDSCMNRSHSKGEKMYLEMMDFVLGKMSYEKNREKLEITNMVMVQNPNTGEVVVQNRIKNWCGISFPGGHAENGETIYDSAIREIKEETGLDIWNLKPCGFMYWFNNQTEDKYFTYFYKTTNYSGEMLGETGEGKVFWTSLDEIKKMKLAPNFKEYLPIFFKDTYTEAYCAWNDDMKPDMSKDNPWGIIYR